MKDNKVYTNEINIQKPSKPHRQLLPSDFPTPEEIKKRYQRQERMDRLGIQTAVLDGDDESEDLDELQASILIMQDKELPPELEKKLLERKQKHQKEFA